MDKATNHVIPVRSQRQINFTQQNWLIPSSSFGTHYSSAQMSAASS